MVDIYSNLYKEAIAVAAVARTRMVVIKAEISMPIRHLGQRRSSRACVKISKAWDSFQIGLH